MDEGPVINKTIVIQVIEKYTEIVKKTKEFLKKERVFGEVKIRMKELFERGRNQNIELDLIDDKDKVKGIIELKHCSLRNFFTFLDLHIKNGLNLVPIVAVDFSLANLTFDEN